MQSRAKVFITGIDISPLSCLKAVSQKKGHGNLGILKSYSQALKKYRSKTPPKNLNPLRLWSSSQTDKDQAARNFSAGSSKARSPSPILTTIRNS